MQRVCWRIAGKTECQPGRSKCHKNDIGHNNQYSMPDVKGLVEIIVSSE
jgi:hypothetical protein